VPGDVKTLGVALMTGIVGFLVANLVDPSARVPGQCAFYYLLLALIGSAYSSVVGTEDQREATEQRRTVTLGLLAVACGVLVAIVWAAVADVRSSTYVVRGETLLSNSSDVSGAEAAIGEFRRACALTPRNPVAQYELANALAGAGRHEEALRVYSIVEALSPNYGRIHFNQGASLYNLHRYSDAEREMAVAYRLDGLPDSRARLDYLRKMLHGPPTELAPVPRTSDPRR
jgi:tetratricopeptide (TPR) repeat protein